MGIKLVVFDFDGTLADSKSTWKKDIEKVLKHHDVEKAENIAHIALVVGRRLDEAMRPLKLKRNKEDAYRLEIYKEFIDGVGKMKFCPGFNTLTKIKQPMIIVSNAQEFLIREFMSKKRKLKMFKAIYGAGDFDKKYKKLRQIRKEYKLKKEEMIYVGDRASDVKNAKKAKCLSVGVANGCNFGGKQEMLDANPDFLISDLSEIKKIVE